MTDWLTDLHITRYSVPLFFKLSCATLLKWVSCMHGSRMLLPNPGWQGTTTSVYRRATSLDKQPSTHTPAANLKQSLFFKCLFLDSIGKLENKENLHQHMENIQTRHKNVPRQVIEFTTFFEVTRPTNATESHTQMLLFFIKKKKWGWIHLSKWPHLRKCVLT